MGFWNGYGYAKVKSFKSFGFFLIGFNFYVWYLCRDLSLVVMLLVPTHESDKSLAAKTEFTVVGHSCELTFRKAKKVSDDIVLFDDCKLQFVFFFPV